MSSRPTVPSGSPTDAADDVNTMRAMPARAAARTAASAPSTLTSELHVRVGRAMGVDPGDVIRERAARHAGGEDVLVEQVAAGHLAPACGDRRRRRVGAREPDHLVTVLEQPGRPARRR